MSAYSLAIAEQSLNNAFGDPFIIYTNQTAQITFTVHIDNEPTLISQSICLFRLDQNGRPIQLLDNMYDDGSHGDEIPNDNEYTTQVNFTETEVGQISFRISAAYRGLFKRVFSNIFAIEVTTAPDLSSIEHTIESRKSIYEKIDTWQQQNLTTNQIIQNVLDELAQNPEVENYDISASGFSVWASFKNGMDVIFSCSPIGTLGSEKAVIFSHFIPDDPKYGQVATDECEFVYNKLSNFTTIVSDEIVTDSDVNIKLFKNLSKYKIVSLMTHGEIGHDDDVILMTGQKIPDTPLPTPVDPIELFGTVWYLIKSDILADYGGYWGIRPAFIRKYAEKNGPFPNSLILFSACYSLLDDNDTMAKAFLENGASTYFGWDWEVSNGFACDTKKALLNLMIDEDKTANEAYQSLANKTDSKEFTNAEGITKKATYQIAGDGNFKFPLKPQPITTTIIPYESDNYRFLVGPHDHTSGFEQPGSDDSGFAIGNAPFGANDIWYYCPLDGTVRTTWQVNTDILLRKLFELPAGTTNLQVGVAIDNDIQVFINGEDISNGMQDHDGCAEQNSFTFTTPDGILQEGTNLLAVRARDEGDISFVDIQITADIPAIPKPIATTEAELSTKFRLEQNYPNPFNPETTIEYVLPEQSHVLVTIYNLLGEKIATLVNQNQDTGYHKCLWNATNQPSGVYIYRIEAGNFAQTKKMILLR